MEYVHVPKSGGTSVQQMLQWMAAHHNLSHHRRDFGDGEPPPPALKHGCIYDGQEPLGWGSAPTPTAFTAISWRRDHLSLIVSLYNYKARSEQKVGLLFHEREKELRKAGVPDEYMFDELLRRNDAQAMFIANTSSSNYLVPASCHHRDASSPLNEVRDRSLTGNARFEDARLAVMLQNLAAIDVVATTEYLDTQLSSQLQWHAPKAKFQSLGHSNANAMNTSTGALTRPIQLLSHSVRSALTRHPTFQREQWLCEFATRVAQARSAHAASCLEMHTRPCPLSCLVNVSERELQLLTRKFPPNVSRNCLQKPPETELK